jgi:hypothetical protein
MPTVGEIQRPGLVFSRVLDAANPDVAHVVASHEHGGGITTRCGLTAGADINVRPNAQVCVDCLNGLDVL